MKLTIISHFRDSESYIDIYINKIKLFNSLLNEQGDELSLVLGYGDSKDNTSNIIKKHYPNSSYDVTHGGVKFGSVVNTKRFQQLAYVANTLWKQIPKDTDYVMLVESDLIWEPEDLLKLVEATQKLEKTHSGAIVLAPMVKTRSGLFYDTWAFRNGGTNFVNQAPYHACFSRKGRFVEMDSIGSVFVVRADVVRDVEWFDADLVVGFCRDAVALGCKIFLDRETVVFHP